MKQNSFISVILTIACSLMFVACSDWTEPTPVDYNPIFPEQTTPTCMKNTSKVKNTKTGSIR